MNSTSPSPTRNDSTVWTPRRWAFFACFFGSGATALVYQVVWTRRLILTFGSALPAVSTVLAVFMGGLALGSFLAGRRTEKLSRPFTAYAVLEGFIGLYAVATPFCFDGIEALYDLLHPTLGGSPIAVFAARFLLTTVILLPPTTAMGATLPCLVRGVVGTREHVGRDLGHLYGANILGAVLGAVGAGFLLLPGLGLSSSVWLTAALNVAIAGVAFGVARRGPELLREEFGIEDEPNGDDETEDEEKEESEAVPALSFRLLLAVFCVTGFSGMAMEVAWNRALGLVLGSSIYAFTIILAVFLLGFGLGSSLFGRIADRSESPVRLLGIVSWLAGVFCLLTLLWIGFLPHLFLATVNRFGTQFRAILLVQVLCSGILVFPPAFLHGALFPIATRLLGDRLQGLGREVGHLYAANTVGAIFGSLLCGALLIPHLGTAWSLALVGLLDVGLGVLLLWHRQRRPALQTALFTLPLLFCLLTPEWDPNVMTSGVYVYAPRLDAPRLGGEVLEMEEGLQAVVSVRENREGVRSICINGKADGSDGADRSTQTLLAQLPLILHPNPKSVYILGFGTGHTAASALTHPSVERVDCVEIEPAVVDLARRWFSKLNAPVFREKGKRVRIHLTDGRTFLRTANRTWDVIVSEPSNPWMSGVSHLFSADYFRLCRSRLGKNGIMCQWLQLYGLSTRDLKIVIRSFRSVFPEASAWKGGKGDLLLLGFDSQMAMKTSELRQRLAIQPIRDEWELARRIMRRWKVFRMPPAGPSEKHFPIVLMLRQMLALNPQEVDRFTAGIPIDTDDHPILEFSAPRSMYLPAEQNEEALRRARGAGPGEEKEDR